MLHGTRNPILEYTGDGEGRREGRNCEGEAIMKSNRNIVVALALGCLVLATAVPAAQRDWQTTMLHNPSAAQLKMEQRGRVFIYDGLQEAEVDRAMDTQFGRVDTMMFIRTKKTTEGGDESTDDDC